MKILRILIIALCCGLSTAAQSLTDSTTTVSMLTCAPGSEIYQLEGHTGLRLKSADFDVVANWGLFDFRSPGFVYRFVKGETDYSVGIIPTELFLQQYRLEGRRVTEQTLALTPQETAKVMQLVNENLLPENRVYRYNYVRDNCALRPIAIVDRAITGDIRLGKSSLADNEKASWRSIMKHYHDHYPWYQFGIDLALGSGIDIPIDEKLAAFAPVALEQMLQKAQRPDGTPLVESARILVDGDAEGTALSPTPLLLRPVAVFWILFAAALAITIFASDTVRNIFDSAFFALVGIAGLILTFLIFVSVHEATSPNYLYLWINPLGLLIACLVWIPRGIRILKLCRMLIFAGMISFAAVAICGVQAFNPAFLPIMLTIMVRFTRITIDPS